jgi:phosphoglycolate phosphatase
MGAEYTRRWGSVTRPYEGIPELLESLEVRGIKRAVLSNKPDEITKLMVEHYFRDASFQAVRGARPSVPKKPDPYAALEIARGLGVHASRMIFLGDTDTDMRTASNAGMYAVGVLWGFRGADELLKNGARELVSRPHEVLDLL